MANDRSGKAKHVKGKVKESVGELLGDRKIEREGRLEQTEGRAAQDASRARERLEEAKEREAAAETARRRSERR